MSFRFSLRLDPFSFFPFVLIDEVDDDDDDDNDRLALIGGDDGWMSVDLGRNFILFFFILFFS